MKKINTLTLTLTVMLTILLIITGCGSSETKAEHKTVSNISSDISDKESSTLTTSTDKLSQQNLIINTVPGKYSYDDMVNDIEQLKNICGELINVVKLCDTIDGRSVYDIIIGDPYGDNQILIFGAMHAREYITSQVVMRQLCSSIDVLNGHGGEYNGVSLKELLNGVTIHFVPMSNPDGVTISQFGPGKINNESVRNKIYTMSDGDYEQWKANAAGIDLNRNFDAGWQEFVGSHVPSSERYKGAFPGSEPEAAALINLVQSNNIKRTISYHTCGALIYWYYKQEGSVLEQSKIFARRISNTTGYPLDSDYTAVDAAGFKDWAVYKMGIPSLTIEVGSEDGYSITNPVPINRFQNIWDRNKNVVYATVYNLKYE